MTPGHVPTDEAAMQLALAEARRGIGKAQGIFRRTEAASTDVGLNRSGG